MKSLLIVGLMTILFMISSCATVPTEPLASGDLRLLRMDIPQKGDLRERLPFVVNLSFEADGKPEIVMVCFFWSGNGPYCSKLTDLNYGFHGTIKVHLYPRNHGSWTLESYVVYKKDGKTESTNVVSTRIRIIPQ